MVQQLINHSPDIKRLWDDGLCLERKDTFLLVHEIPYVAPDKQPKLGTLVATLHLTGDTALKPDTHVCYFIGEKPCDKNGNPLSAIIISEESQILGNELQINFTFSSKPKEGYIDYYEKLTTYITILSSQAKSINPELTEKKYKIYETSDNDSVFMYGDTNSTRAGIYAVSEKLKELKVGIVGLGGTGSYILDLVAKTPVKEIHLYDGDDFQQHNAFRAPGAASIDKFKNRLKKVDYLWEIYSNMHRAISAHPYNITSENIHELQNLDFLFISVDNGTSKKLLVEFLEKFDIPFVDVGLGVQKVEDELIGIVAVTTSTKSKREPAKNGRINFAKEDNNEYSKNIQISDLNALNATLAVIKWKKLYGFYQDLEKEHFSTYSINVNQLLSEDLES